MPKIKVLIADDHYVVRKGIRQIIAEQPDMEVLGEAVDGIETLEKTKELQPDVLLLDIAMPELSGLEVGRILKDTGIKTKIVVLSMHAKESYVHQILDAGALGYVLKDAPSTDIMDAIHAAWRGEYYLSPKIEAGVVESYLKNKNKKPAVKGYDLLSEREQQVFRLVVEGKTANEIADILFLSPKTVSKHKLNIMNKLGIHGRLELLKYAIQIGVVDPALWG